MQHVEYSGFNSHCSFLETRLDGCLIKIRQRRTMYYCSSYVIHISILNMGYLGLSIHLEMKKESHLWGNI